jgi:hypothetical protein
MLYAEASIRTALPTTFGSCDRTGMSAKREHKQS